MSQAFTLSGIFESKLLDTAGRILAHSFEQVGGIIYMCCANRHGASSGVYYDKCNNVLSPS